MTSEAVLRIQQALSDKDFNPGALDGIWGRNTIAAVMRFQAQNGLKVDGIVGAKTSAALFSATPSSPSTDTPLNMNGVLPWFEEAKHLVGTKEVLGPRSNPVILDWASSLELHYSGDDIPWCGLFVAHCVGATLPQETLPGNPLGARQWARFGDPTPPRTGAVMVFWRGSRSSGKGHVGFYVSEDDNAYQILGGNQQNSVCFTWVGKDRFLEARWPKTASSLHSETVREDRQQSVLSSNEE